ncbi:hypothetical protein A4X13_0g2519 [Tilletia indica]|uniref:Uncharacterized protein n=1 Tax=Tilletia indica TaxID=43049 RepID=A0A177TJS0_9BASI|nr:hypothetical protein A4X13_0g2519 [Tilletia indica]
MPALRVKVSRPNRYYIADRIKGHRLNPTTDEEEAFVQWADSYVPLYMFSNQQQAQDDVNDIKQAERQRRAGARNTDGPHQDDEPLLDNPRQDSPSFTPAAPSLPTLRSSSSSEASSLPTSTPSSSSDAPQQDSPSRRSPSAGPSSLPTSTPSSSSDSPRQVSPSRLSPSAGTSSLTAASSSRPSSSSRPPQKRSVASWRKILDNTTNPQRRAQIESRIAQLAQSSS